MTQRHWFAILLLGFLLASSLTGPLTAATWKVGTAATKITPERPLWLAGYASRVHPSDSVLHDIWVKALALEDADGAVAVVVTSDLLGIPPTMDDRLADAIEKQCGLDRAHLLLSASHTHSGPVLDGALDDVYPLDDQQRQRIKEYTAGLEKTIVATVARAMAERTPATLWAGEGKAGFAVNRRNNVEAKVPELRAKGQLVGPSDHDVPVLAVRKPDGKLRAVVFGYACHATTLDIYGWSGDYPGFAQLAIEKNQPGVQAMFFQGCGADQNPLPRRSVELCKKYGDALAASVDGVLETAMRPIAPRLRAGFEFIALDFGKKPTREELAPMAKGNDYKACWAKSLLANLDAGRKPPTQCRYPVQVWRLGGDQLWIALGGEVVVDYALKFKTMHGPTTWVAGYANEVPAYIPSERVVKEGGYEAGAFSAYGLPAEGWAPGIEARITEAVERLAEKTK
jgi:neutral ceramidase